MLQPQHDAYQAVEILLKGVAATGNTNAQFFFPDLPFLRPDKATIVAVELFTPGSVTYSGLSNTTMLPIANLKTATITFYGQVPKRDDYGEIIKDAQGRRVYDQQGGEFIQRVQLVKLNTIQNSATDPFSRSLFRLNDAVVDFSKSYLNFIGGPLNTADNVVALGVYFNYKK
jgi:hypothetical protein